MNKRNYQILKYLKETEEYVTSETLSAMNNVSTKTILKDIKSLNCDMKATDNYIEVTPSRGIKLVINDIEEFINLCNSFNDTNDFSIYSVTEREEWIQKYLIENNGWVKAEALCEKLFISQSVLSQNIKSVRKAFQKYDLILLQKPHYGMRVEGREFNKRLCLAQIYITHIDQREGFPGTQFNNDELQLILKIEDIVDRILTRYQISMSEVSVQNFIIDIYISLKRIKKGIFLKSTDKMVIDIARWTDSIVAVELAKLINDELTIEMKDQEIVSLSIHLAAKRIICHFDESIHRIIEDFDVNKLVNNMINNINCKWGIDLTQDEELKSQLVLHLIPLEVRSRYNVVLHNPLIDKIKQQNIFAYQMAVTACDQFSDYHGNRLSEDEMGYIALHMNLALLRTQIKNKKNILVVSGLGRGTAHTLAYHIVYDCCRISTRLSSDQVHTGTMRPFGQLFTGCGTVSIRCGNDDFFALIFQLSCQFSDRCGFSHTIDTDHQHNGFSVFKFIGSVTDIHLSFDLIDQKLFAFGRFFDLLFCHFFFQMFNNGCGRIDTDIPHYENLFYFLIEIIIDAGKAAENRIDSGYNIISCLCQTFAKTSEKAFLFL